MKAYSQDLRERILRSVDLSRPRAEIMQLFGVSSATIKRYLKQRREEGHVRPKAIPGRSPRETGTGRSECPPSIPGARRRHIGATLCHVGANARRTGEPMDHESGDQTAGLDAKKKSIGATERNEEERAAWREKASSLPTDALVFLDETGSNMALTPLYARALRGERARGKVPRFLWKT